MRGRFRDVLRRILRPLLDLIHEWDGEWVVEWKTVVFVKIGTAIHSNERSKGDVQVSVDVSSGERKVP